MKNGLTLIEILVTVIIISFAIALTMPSYDKLQESGLDKEAFGNLKRIQEAQKFYNMEVAQGANYYYPSSGTTTNIANINAYLKLSLPNVANPNWIYTVKSTGCGQATRNVPGGSPFFRTWRLEINEAAEGTTFSTGNCP